MAVGKNKRLTKGGKKGSKKKAIDPFSRKQWYTVKSPSIFWKRDVAYTIASKGLTQKENLKGRVFTMSLGDMKENGEEDAYRKIKLRVEDVQGTNCLTNFYGMDFTTDKLRSLVKKWQTLIECVVDTKTSDQYTLRVFCIGFTKKMPNQVKRTCYAQSSQIKAIRRKMKDIINKEVTNSTLIEVVQKLNLESIGKQIEKATQGIFPLHNVFIRKTKVVRTPKFDAGKLMEIHDTTSSAMEDVGQAVERPAEEQSAEAAAQ